MTAAADADIGLCLTPLDTLFFRDGRPFETRGRSGLPNPQTLAGAVRTMLLRAEGFDFARFAEARQQHPDHDLQETLKLCNAPPWWGLDLRFRGPWIALRCDNGRVLPLLPVPWTLLRNEPKPGIKSEPEGEWFRARPTERVPGWRPPPEAPRLLPLWHAGDPDAKHPGGFLTPAGVAAFLKGQTPTDVDWFRERDLFDFDARTGVALDVETLTAAKGFLYAVSLLALRRRMYRPDSPYDGAAITIYATVYPPSGVELADRLHGPMPFGGEGRYVTVEPVPAYTWDEPATNGRSLWLLATPGLFAAQDDQASWRPDAIPADRLRAAGSGPALAVSGWDVARAGPRPTRFAVPAGAVYYADGAGEPPQRSLCGDAEDVAQGWGFALRGVWHG